MSESLRTVAILQMKRTNARYPSATVETQTMERIAVAVLKSLAVQLKGGRKIGSLYLVSGNMII